MGTASVDRASMDQAKGTCRRLASAGYAAMKGRPNAWRVFGAPVLIAVLTMAGLLAGLLWGEGGRHVSWAGVGSPVVVAAWTWLRVRIRHRCTVTSPARYRRG
jgi:hypothetical protein